MRRSGLARLRPVAVCSLASAMIVLGAAAEAAVCPAPAKLPAGEFAKCSKAGGWRLAAPGFKPAKASYKGDVALHCDAKTCGQALQLEVRYADGNDGVAPEKPFTRESYLARWNEKGLYDLAWVDSEDEGTSEPAKDIKGRVLLKSALFHFKTTNPKAPAYDRLVAVTWGRGQLYMFRFKGAPDTLANNERVAAILNSVEVVE
jgi:hypothetical protein